jgi:diguanylate cyclase (GGDEF)-like protein
MHLDVGTLSVVTVFVTALLGALLIFAGVQNRSIRAPMWWGGANMVGAIGLGLGVSGAPKFLTIDLANALVLLGCGLTWAGARVFDGRKVLPLVIVFAPLVWLAACRIPAFESSCNLRVMVVSTMSAMLAAATAEEFWRGRAEALLSRWPTVIVLLAYAASLLARIPVTFSALFDVGSATEGFSLALTAFGTLLFSVVVSFLLLNLTKERTELQHKINAMVDPLSGVANRRAFLDGASKLLLQQHVEHEPLAMLLFDLDHFKDINDCMGHAVGDRVLQTFAATATSTLGSEALFGRIGGEEFAALTPVGDVGEGYAIADRVRRKFRQAAAHFAHADLVPTVSVGFTVSVLPAAGVTNGARADAQHSTNEDVDRLLEIADRALYRAKANGRNRVEATAAEEMGARVARAPSIVPLIKTEPIAYPQARGWRRRVAQ